MTAIWFHYQQGFYHCVPFTTENFLFLSQNTMIETTKSACDKLALMTKQRVFSVIKLLADGQFHSGETIAKQLNVSRATIWNAIQTIESLGVEVFSVRGRGYKLSRPVTLLDEHAILSGMAKKQAQRMINVEVHHSLDSTNSFLMQHLSDQHIDRLCIACDLQTNGRGRRGRTWQAALGASLTFSLLWRFSCGAADLTGLSLAVGLSLTRALHQLGISNAQLKWPNDVVIKKTNGTQHTFEKLAGILIELQGDMDGPSTAVIGIGINLNLNAQTKAAIDQPVTDIASILDDAVNPNNLLSLILVELQTILHFFENNGFSALKKEWLENHAYHDEAVKLLHPNGNETIANIADIADDGALIADVNGTLQRFSSGEISLRTTHSE